MTKTELFNLVLDEFNIPPVTEEQVENSETREIKILDMRLSQAISRVCTEFDWSWLDTYVDLSKIPDEGQKAGYAHSYTLPSTFFRITYVPCEKYRIIGRILLAEEEVSYIIVQPQIDDSLFDNAAIPDTWWTIVSYALAMFCLSSISNNNTTIASFVDNKYSTLLSITALKDEQSRTRRLTTDAF